MVFETAYEPFEERFEYNANKQLLYHGWAQYGVGEDTASWRICKYTFDGNGLQLTKKWSSKNFDSNWANRTSLTYI